VAERFGLSERRVCRLLELDRNTLRYRSRRQDDAVLRTRIREIAETKRRYGCPRIYVRLRREGWQVNHKKVERLYYRDEGLSLRRRRRKKAAAVPRVALPKPTQPGRCYAMDFVHDRLANGRRFKCLTMTDPCSKEVPVMEVDVSIGGARVCRILDRLFANYGSETAATRDLLRGSVRSALNRMWPDKKSSQTSQLDPSVSSGEAFFNSIQNLSPQNDVQRSLKSQAVQIATDLGQMRWLLFEQTESSISLAMLIVLISWLAIIFMSAVLFAPPNATVIVAVMLAALSVAGAIFLILELDMPFDGVIQISPVPMRNALIHLGH